MLFCFAFVGLSCSSDSSLGHLSVNSHHVNSFNWCYEDSRKGGSEEKPVVSAVRKSVPATLLSCSLLWASEAIMKS